MICRIARVYDHRNKKGEGGERFAQRGLPKEPEMGERGGGDGRVGSLRRGCILRFTLGYLARSIGRGWIFPRLALKLKETMTRGMTKQKLSILSVSRFLEHISEFLNCTKTIPSIIIFFCNL